MHQLTKEQEENLKKIHESIIRERINELGCGYGTPESAECTSCGWRGTEDDLDSRTNPYGWGDDTACPECGSIDGVQI